MALANRRLYFNHAGTSWPKPAVVQAAVQEAMTLPHTEWQHRFEAAHQAIADYFSVPNPEQILLTPGCTSALAVGIGDSLAASGKQVLTSQWEHHALHRPLLKHAAAGFPVDYIPPMRTGGELSEPIDLNWLEESLSVGDVGLVAITAACNVTGELLPYRDVIRMSHQHGAQVMIDAAQIVGWQQLDFVELGADMVAFGGHKGLQAPWGIGGLYLSGQVEMSCTSASCELPSPNSASRSESARPGYCDVGSVDQVALSGLHAAIEMLTERDTSACLNRARSQIQRIREALEMFDRTTFYSPSDPAASLPSLALSVSGVPSNELASRMREHGITVGSGLLCAPLAHQALGTETNGLIRISVGLEQADDDIDEALNRLPIIFDGICRS